ncbi:MAG TPA: recombinase family protein [Candidatus Tumulicola sp.]|nr:recombinase family protein [Candidatus Tumulicola sp.]
MADKSTRKVYGYARVSSRGQADEGISLDAQQARIEGYALAKGWALTDVLIDAARSGKNTRRPMLERLRREVREGQVETIITLKVDRVSRSTRDLLNLLQEFETHKTSFVSVFENIDTSTSMGRFVITLLGSLAQLEAEQVGERTSFALRKARLDGKAYCRTAPFGWKRVGGDFRPAEAEQRALAQIRTMRAKNDSWQSIARWLAENRIKPRAGDKWYPATVRQVLNSKLALEAA